MIANADSSNSVALTGVRKAAMLLVILGDQSSAELVKEFSDDEVQLISREIARVRQITSEEADTVLAEFHHMLTARDYIVNGGIDYAKKMLLNAFGPDNAKK